MSVIERWENRLLSRYLVAQEPEAECECGEGLTFCPLHDDEDEAMDWEKVAEERDELREARAERD